MNLHNPVSSKNFEVDCQIAIFDPPKKNQLS